MTARKHPPLLRRGPFSGRVYIITRYTRRGDDGIVASEKWDVTDQYDALVAETQEAD